MIDPTPMLERHDYHSGWLSIPCAYLDLPGVGLLQAICLQADSLHNTDIVLLLRATHQIDCTPESSHNHSHYPDKNRAIFRIDSSFLHAVCRKVCASQKHVRWYVLRTRAVGVARDRSSKRGFVIRASNCPHRRWYRMDAKGGRRALKVAP